MRTHFCGLIDEALIGQSVTLCGWADVARNLGGLCFIDLRDHEGIVQVVVEPEQVEALQGRAPAWATRTACSVKAWCARAKASTTRSIPARWKWSRPTSRCSTRPSRCRSTRTRTRARNPPEVPLPRPAPPGDAAHDAHPHQAGRGAAPLAGRARLPGHRNPDPDQGHARGRARLPGAGAHASGRVLRAAAVAAAVQADPDDGRLRPLLPDRALLPRRGAARRPPAGIHPARHGVRLRPRARRAGHRRGHDPHGVPRGDAASNWRPSSRA